MSLESEHRDIRLRRWKEELVSREPHDEPIHPSNKNMRVVYASDAWVELAANPKNFRGYLTLDSREDAEEYAEWIMREPHAVQGYMIEEKLPQKPFRPWRVSWIKRTV